MSYLCDQIKFLFENELYSNVVALSSFVLSMIDHTSEATSPEKFQTYAYYGNSLFHLGQYRRAIAMFKKALQFRKDYFRCVGSNKISSLKKFMPDTDIKYQIHLCHINLKQIQEALTVLESIPGKQRSLKVNMALGKLYRLCGFERSSSYVLKEVLKECPLALDAIEGLLNVSSSGAEVQSIVLKSANEKGIGNIDWVMSWIKAHDQINSREYGHAINTLEQLDKHSGLKNNHNLLTMLGETYFNAGDSKNALSVLQRAHLLEPQLEKGLDLLASLLAKEKMISELEKLVPTYIPLREYGPETWIAMAYYFYVNKKTRKAAYLAQKACLLNPRNVEGLLLKGAIFLDLKKYQDSVVHYREAMHLSPYRYEAYEGLVNCYIAMHRLREALTVASGVCKQLGQNPRTLTLYASVLMKDSVSVCKAKNLLTKALQHDDKFLPAVYLLVIILDQELKLGQGIAILEKQIQIQPNCKLHHMLGDLYSKNHQLEKATEQYMIALQMDPNNRKLQEAMGKLNQTCNKIDTSYYVAVNDDNNINTTYELGDSENEMLSPTESVEKENADDDKGSKKESNKELINKPLIMRSRNIPMKGKIRKKVEEQTRDVTIPLKLPVALYNTKSKSSSSSKFLDDEYSGQTIMIPATEIKKTTTIEKTCPKRVQTYVVSELQPEISTLRNYEKSITEIKTPIRKHLTTTTTVKRTTLVTTETTTIVGHQKGATISATSNKMEESTKENK